MPLRSKSKFITILLFLLIILLYLSKTINISRIAPFLFPKKEKLEVIKYFPFSSNESLKEWDEKVFHKKVDYKVESSNGESYIRAVSDSSCSAMYHKIKLDATQHPMLFWKWRINNFPDKKSRDNLLSKEEDDFGARMYVIFPAMFFTNTKVLEYIWSKDLQVGTISSSPYSDNIKLIVVESGPNDVNAWVSEERNIYEDYVIAFNAKPRLKIGAIAFMCDSDSTESNAEAFFDDIKVFYKD
jgi:hypothetical protein